MVGESLGVMWVAAGWLATGLIGVTMGLLGGGGSILTVPVLAYLFGLPGTVATGASLFVVGVGALAGAWGPVRSGEVGLREVGLFAGPSALGVWLVRRFGVPALPEQVLGMEKDGFLLASFGVLMLTVSVMMIRGRKEGASGGEGGARVWLVPGLGFGVGALAGFVGAGGGFLIVPALVLVMGLEMGRAVPTSLAIIAVQSLVGFTGELALGGELPWELMLGMAVITVAGVGAGQRLKGRFEAGQLRRGFGWLVMLVGGVMLARELGG